ncbi:MAG: hypothetical protein ACXVNM_11275 [Bacteroidia bacterium]
MRSISLILFYSFFLLTFKPGTVMIANSIMADCSMSCDTGESCTMEDMACCPQMCNSSQCCICCFVCPVDNKKIEIRVFETPVKNNLAEEQFLLPGYTSELLQPPKV